MGAFFGILGLVAAIFAVGAVMERNGRKALISGAVFIVAAIGASGFHTSGQNAYDDDCTRFSSFANSCD
ncbi:hypothetical protein CN085_19760 [Sinorhizobium meliloti]|uniref:hypothetical protein n=1 Tax=Rhizobium meliloti TaxID=382 RepID=UPI000FDC0A0A|nr:hypothetical protein [Sinorhizobium meliloti]MDW9762147.1 hypothetical protein [Sinorhizobium meliloti]MDX1117024.1 hypothetical protein [Sinorhizobium medicae]RVP13150.1 hypothetical protein CN085_19760 [Sinorhizobium meliloti]